MADRVQSADLVVPAGSTSLSIPVWLEAPVSGGAGLTPVTGKVAADVVASYWRQGGSRTAIAVADLPSLTAAYSAGGWKEVDAATQPGLYRFDLPDAALVAGADWVVVSVVVSGARPVHRVLALPTWATLREAIFDTVVESEGNYTAQQVLSILFAVLAGVTASGGTVIKTPNGAATRVSATIDASANRLAMTLTPSA
ncbi:MAG TPA: hypothetical protein VNK50_13100 [Calidithermus sp.]|nr:hypothetical protein [Calidithermus sp.]